MRRWIIIIAIVVVAFLVIGILQDQGVFDFQWQWLAMIFAALAGPYKLLKNALSSKSDATVDGILAKNKTRRQEEEVHRKVFDEQIKEKEERIASLQKEVELLDTKIQLIEQKRKNVPEDINKMNNKEKKQEFLDIYGDEQ